MREANRQSRAPLGRTLRLQNVAIFYVCLWGVAPPLAYHPIYRVLAVMAVVGWCLLEVCRRQNIFVRPSAPVAGALVYLLYTAALEATTGDAAEWDWHIQPAIMLFFLIVYESRRHALHTLTPVFWWIFVTLPIWMGITIYTLASNSRAARILVRSSDEAIELAQQGVGGYSLVYLTVALLPVAAYLTFAADQRYAEHLPKLLRRLQRPLPLLTGTTVVLGVFLVLNAQYSIAIYLTILALGSLALSRRPISLVIFVLFAMVLALFGEDLLLLGLHGLEAATSGSNISRKIADIQTSIEMDQAVGTLGDRMDRYQRSLALLWANPLVGVIEFTDIGKHSSFLDRFARYGMLIGLLFMYLVLYVPVRMMRQLKSGFGMAFGVFVVALLFPALNNVYIGFGAALYLLFPVAASFFHMESGERVRRTPIMPAPVHRRPL